MVISPSLFHLPLSFFLYDFLFPSPLHAPYCTDRPPSHLFSLIYVYRNDDDNHT